MNMKKGHKKFRATPGMKVDLDACPTLVEPLYKSKSAYRKRFAAEVEALGALQRLLFASSGYALLLVFQGMDGAGKDGAIGHVLSGVNPEGCDVHSFKQPSADELAHDFLWRTTAPLPARGRIGVFNRSYYEEVLIVRVHPELLNAQGIPGRVAADSSLWDGRFRSIVAFEKHLHRNGTVVLKFFLHLSKEEQRRRFLARIDDPDKNWKLSQADINERKFWKQYQTAYEDCLSRTSTRTAPWYVIPADDKQNARLIISRIVIDALKRLKLSYPRVSEAQRHELVAIRKQLEAS
jgi:PPK2 family polyphosphate:nucleotide phosphotransferase